MLRTIGALLMLVLVAGYAAPALTQPVGGARVLKTVTRTFSFAPNGTVLDARVYASLSLEAWGSVCIADKLAFVEPGSVEAKGGLQVSYEHNVASLSWVLTGVKGRADLRYTARPSSPPVVLALSVSVNGAPAQVKCKGALCVMEGRVGDRVEYVLHIKNNLDIGGLRPPFLVTVVMVVDTDLLNVEEAEPEPSVSVLAGSALLTWGFMLRDSCEVRLVLTVRKLNKWFEAPLPSVRVTASLSPTKTLESLREVERQLNETIRALHAVEKLANSSREGVREVFEALEGMESELESYASLLSNASAMAFEASDALMNASLAAERASARLSAVASSVQSLKKLKAEVRQESERLSEILHKIGNVTETLARLQELGLVSQVPDLESGINEARRALKVLTSALSKVDSYSSELNESLEATRELAYLLREASLKMRALGSALNSTRAKVLEAREKVRGYLETLKERAGSIDRGLAELSKVKEGLLAELERTRADISACLALARIYDSQTPVATIGTSDHRGTLLSDEIVATVANVRVLGERPGVVAAPGKSERSGSYGTELVAALGIVLSATAAALIQHSLAKGRRNEELDERMRVIEEELRELRSLVEEPHQ